MTNSRAVFIARIQCLLTSKLSQETQYLSSILWDTFVKCICRNASCALGKWGLPSRWNFSSIFSELHVYDDERWRNGSDAKYIFPLTNGSDVKYAFLRWPTCAGSCAHVRVCPAIRANCQSLAHVCVICFREGRTETVRPCSIDSAAFVKATLDPTIPVMNCCTASEAVVGLATQAKFSTWLELGPVWPPTRLELAWIWPSSEFRPARAKFSTVWPTRAKLFCYC